jgi:UDP:flavonoid glycosyltransferase YjiC (YdhE family)
MRILFSSIRGPGHFHPMLPFMVACRRRGHDVLVAAPEDLRGTVERAAFAFHPFAHPGDDALGRIWSRLPALSADEAGGVVVREILPDLIVRESSEYAAFVAAEASGIPLARIGIMLAASEERILRLAIDSVDRLRTATGLAADGGKALRSEPIFTAMPRSLEDPEVLGPPTTLRVRSVSDDTPKPLPKWWDDDARPLVYVTFGSIAGGMPTARGAFTAALEAVADLPVRVLLTTGHGIAPGALGVVPPNAHVEAWVPQGDVLPHAAVIVCHAGSGTMIGALEAGVPIVAVPLFADQPQNAKRIAEVGAGVVVEGRTATADALRTAIRQVLANDAYRSAAQRLAREIAALPTTDAAVDAFEALIAAR